MLDVVDDRVSTWMLAHALEFKFKLFAYEFTIKLWKGK